MKKRLLSVVLAAMLLLVCVPLGAVPQVDAATSGYLTYTYNYSSGEVMITDCDPSISGTLVIPDTWDDSPVTRIGSSAFEDCTSLTSVVIPDSVTGIDYYAFKGCRSLTSVTIGDSVTSIGWSVFSGCASLTSVTIGDSVTSIGDYAFSGCSSLTSVHITDMAAWCRINFSSSTSNPLCQGGKLYLNGTPVTKLTIPKEITSIGTYAFSGCNWLTSVTIPDSVTSIGTYAFSDCASLTSVTIGDSVTSIGSYAFSDCDSLTSVTIPDSVTSIGSYAFSDCDGLTSVDIGNSVTSIGSRAFEYCASLTSVSIPVSVKDIDYDAFWNCPLEVISYGGTQKQWEILSSNAGIYDDTKIYYNHAFPTVDFQIANTASGVKVSWPAVEGATGYRVYRSTYSGGKWSDYVRYTTTSSLSYLDKNVKSGVKVRYIVYAYNGILSSKHSYPKATTYLSTPSVKSTNTAAGVSVTWAKVPGATKYNVYRSTLSNGKWSDYVRYTTTSNLSYVDKNAKSGTSVKYAVYAYSADGSRSALGTAAAMVRLSQPVVTVKNAATGATISWGKVAGATSYNVYRSTLSNGKWSDYVRCKSTTGLTYTDTTVKSGTSVKYAVYAYKSSYRSSLGTGNATYYLSQPAVKVENGVTAVKVTWGKVAGATSYRVYRSTYVNGSWSKYVLYQTTTSTGYADKNVSSGTRVRYMVYAYKGTYHSADKTGVITRFLSQPTAKLAKATTGVKISWNKVTGAAGYKIYRSVYKNGKWSTYALYKSTTALTYTDTSIKAGTKVRYTVYAFNSTTLSAEKTGVSITR